jgi:alpha-galactosidase
VLSDTPVEIVTTFAPVAPPVTAGRSHPAWAATAEYALDRTWRGDPAPPALATTARLLWTAGHLCVAFTCAFTELDADDAPVDTTAKRPGLWERDVCEAFVWSPAEPSTESYREFEVAPTGQWYDVAVRRPRVDVDHAWRSGMETAAAVDAAARTWHATMRLPWSAFGRAPQAGDRWRINLFRIGRHAGERHYLAWSPTGTARPDFHVPAAFVPLVFA